MSAVTCGLKDNGCYQTFQNGAINWTPNTGAKITKAGAIRSYWASQNYENGRFGYPVTDEICGQTAGGCYQDFQGGSILWSPTTGAQPSTPGAIRTTWAQTGYHGGPLGYPTNAETCGLKDNGCYQTFQNGAINWTPNTGAKITKAGAIRSYWASQNYENGRFGYPVTDEICGQTAGGCYQDFQGGSILWSPTTGAQPSTPGAIRTTWAQTGYHGGPLGYPTNAETCGLKDNGCYQTFQNGAINWTPNTGAKITKAGAIRSYWASQNYENGRFGYPVTDEICGQTAGGCYQDFQGGSILWSPTTGAQPSTPGAIRTTWAQTGYHGGPLGYPTNAETCNGEVCRQSFQNGIITWTRSAGTSVGYNSLVVNKRRPLNPIDYAPASTRNVSGVPMEAVAGSAANSLISAAAAEGVTVTTVSGYRDYWTQKGLYEDYVRRYGQQQADLISARPGFSEHQTGLALDIGDVTTGCGLQDCFENTAAGTWAKNNAWRFGFIIRYPKGFTSTTGYSYEPWHLRYVGTGISTDMRNHNVSTLEQYFGLPAAPDY